MHFNDPRIPALFSLADDFGARHGLNSIAACRLLVSALELSRDEINAVCELEGFTPFDETTISAAFEAVKHLA